MDQPMGPNRYPICECGRECRNVVGFVECVCQRDAVVAPPAQSVDADMIRYMRIQSGNDSESVKAVKWQFCGLVTLACNHSSLADGIQGTLETLFDYCQYLIETGQ